MVAEGAHVEVLEVVVLPSACRHSERVGNRYAVLCRVPMARRPDRPSAENSRALRGHPQPTHPATWGSVPLASVTHAEVQRWLSRLELAPASVRKTHRVLSMALAYAVKDGRLAVNPAAGVSLPRVQQAERRFLTYRQVHELAEECGDALPAAFPGVYGFAVG